MSLAGTTIYLHDFCRPLAKRLESRKRVGPYQWTVPQGCTEGRGYYAADDDGTPGDSTFHLRSVERPPHHAISWTPDDGFTWFSPVVLRLPHGRGFLAGWTMGARMASSVSFDIHDNERDAWLAAAQEAESASEAEACYQAEQAQDEEEE